MVLPLIALAGAVAGAASERYGLPVPSINTILGQFPMNEENIKNIAYSNAANILRGEEGYNLTVYKDSLGYLTVGIGHKVTSSDNLKLGQKISATQANAFFKADIDRAFNAAISQAKELNKFTPDMIARLTSVNFQLGTGWRYKFPNTWSYLKQGMVDKAVKNLVKSAWAQQTPNRVSAFVNTLRQQYA